jgi:hypothetical protein
MSKAPFALPNGRKEVRPSSAMKRGCALWFILFIALTVAYGTWFGNPVLGAMFAFLMLAALGLLSTPIRKREELALVKEAGYSPFRPDAVIFRDGRRVALIGYIYPLHGAGIKAPFSHKDCVAYSYEVATPAGEEGYKKYEGFRLAPSVIVTPRGDIKLLAYPELQGFPATPEAQMSRRNALDYIRATAFASFKTTDMRKAYENVISELMNSSGSARTDTRYYRAGASQADEVISLGLAAKGQTDLEEDDILEEICVGIRDEVCVIGTWSAALQGIVSDFAVTGKRVTLTRGNQQHVLESIRRKMILYPLTGLGLAVMGNLIAWWVATW